VVYSWFLHGYLPFLHLLSRMVALSGQRTVMDRLALRLENQINRLRSHCLRKCLRLRQLVGSGEQEDISVVLPEVAINGRCDEEYAIMCVKVMEAKPLP